MKRISSNMKSILKKTIYGCLALSCVLTIVACSNTSGGSDSGSNGASGNNPKNAVKPTVPTSSLNLYLETTGDHGHPEYKQTATASASIMYNATATSSEKKFFTMKTFLGSSYDVTRLSGDYHVSGDKGLKTLSKDQIKDLLTKTDPKTTWPQEYYKDKPDYNAPQYAGQLSDDALLAGLDRVNAIRRLSGVKPVVIDPEYTRKAQLGALMLHLNNSILTHGFSGSAKWGMGSKDFSDGNEALTHGNLANYNLPASADNWLQDPGQGTNSQAGIGHRIWMTAPVAGKFGFGYMEKKATGRAAAEMTGYAMLRACDSSASGKSDWDFVAWPAPGYTPLGLWENKHVLTQMGTSQVITSMWSVYFNGGNDVKYLFLEKLGENGTAEKTWGAKITTNAGNKDKPFTVEIFGKELKPIDDTAQYGHKFEADSFDTNFAVYTGTGPGATNAQAISFYPTNDDLEYKDGDKYLVTLITDEQNKKGFHYLVEFFAPNQETTK